MPVYGGAVQSATMGTVAEARALGIVHRLIVNTGCFLPAQRNGLVKEALADEATHVLFLDADVACPPEHLRYLRETMERFDASIVCALVNSKPAMVAAYGLADDMPRCNSAISPDAPHAFDVMRPRYEHVTDMRDPACVTVSTALGSSSLMLIRADAFARVEPPWFSFVERAPGEQPFPEDWHFCLRAQRAGVRVAFDPRVETRHYGTTAWCRDQRSYDATAVYNRAVDAALVALAEG